MAVVSLENMKIGDKEVELKQYRNDWALALMSNGIIVKMTVSRWRATASLTSDELGIKLFDESSRNFMEKYISLGREKLFPPEVTKEIAAIERRARENLKAHSFPTVWGWFVPFKAFDSWEKENEKIRQEFFSAANAIGEKYPIIVNTVKTEYKQMAQDVWKRLYPKDNSAPTDSFTESFVNKIIEKIPSRMDVVASFKYDVTYFIIPMPSIIEENISKARKEQRDREMEDFNLNLEKGTKQKVAETYLKRKQELIDGFLESTVCNMRKHVAELCDGVLQSVARQSIKNDITRSHRDKIKRMIERVRLLNFYDDKEMNLLLTNLETEVDRFKGERDGNEIIHTLQKIVNIGTEEFIPKDFNPSISGLEI